MKKNQEVILTSTQKFQTKILTPERKSCNRDDLPVPGPPVIRTVKDLSIFDLILKKIIYFVPYLTNQTLNNRIIVFKH